MNEDLFTIGKEVLNIIKNNHFEAYFVGGCVRDFLLNKPVTDIDITTNATPNQISKLFDSVFPIGIEHGTVLVRYKEQSFEITTYRTDGTYSDKRHPDSVKFIKSINEDLKRRDFTINALAMDEQGEIIDLFHGKKDLDHKIIRAVGNPKERFSEDPLRMIRALRFSSQLGFSIESETLKEMVLLKEQIGNIAQERITEEIRRFFSGTYVNKGMHYLKKSGLYKYLPIFCDHKDLIKKIPNKLNPLSDFSEVIALLHIVYQEIPISTWVKQWKCSNEVKRNAFTLVKAYKGYINRGLDPLVMYPLPAKLFSNFVNLINNLQEDNISLEEVNQCYQQLPIKNAQELAISGSDLLSLFPQKKPGPWIQIMLNLITEKVLLNEIDNSRSELKELAKCHMQTKMKQ